MSHAQTGWHVDDESLLSIGRMTDWMHTANAATIASRGAAQRYVGMANTQNELYFDNYT